jgi:hypothetical protein
MLFRRGLDHLVSSFTEEKGRWGRTLGPVDDMLNVLLAVLEFREKLLLVRVQEVGLGRAAFVKGHGPAAVLDAGRDVAGEGVCVGGGEVQVLCAGGAVV